MHGIDSGMECIPAGSNHGGNRSSRVAYHGACMAKDGKQDRLKCQKLIGATLIGIVGALLLGCRYVSDEVWSNMVVAFVRDCGNCNSPLPDSIHQRAKE